MTVSRGFYHTRLMGRPVDRTKTEVRDGPRRLLLLRGCRCGNRCWQTVAREGGAGPAKNIAPEVGGRADGVVWDRASEGADCFGSLGVGVGFRSACTCSRSRSTQAAAGRDFPMQYFPVGVGQRLELRQAVMDQRSAAIPDVLRKRHRFRRHQVRS